jgi:hypothetical protein
MNTVRLVGKALLALHLFVCCVWLVFFSCIFHGRPDPETLPEWMFHVLFWSALGVQFTWGFSVGFLVGPTRQRRDMLWWSLLTIPYPFWWASQFVKAMYYDSGIIVAALYMALFAAILASETYGGVLLGAKLNSEVTKADD